MTKNELKGHTCAFLANSLWGALSPISKALMLGGAVSPLILTDLRVTGALICFWTLSFFLPRERVAPGDLLRLLGASLLGIVFNQGSFIFAVSLTSPANASIMTTSLPMWAMILAAFFLKERITSGKILGLLLGAAGAVILITGSAYSAASRAGSASILGDLLAILAQISFASYMVLYKNFVSRYSLVTIMKWMFTYSFILLLPLSAPGLAALPWRELSAVDYGCVLYVAVGGTFASYLLAVYALKRLSPTVAGMYNYVQPTVACILAVLWGYDSVTLPKALAVLLIFCGVYLVSTAGRKRRGAG